MADKKNIIGDALRQEVVLSVSEIGQLAPKSAAALSNVVDTHLGPVLEQLGQAVERRLTLALQEAQGEDIEDRLREEMAAALSTALATKIVEKTLKPMILATPSPSDKVSKIADIALALGGLTESELDKLSKTEIDTVVGQATAAKRTAAKKKRPPEEEVPSPRSARPQVRPSSPPPYSPPSYSPSSSSSGSWGGKGSKFRFLASEAAAHNSLAFDEMFTQIPMKIKPATGAGNFTISVERLFKKETQGSRLKRTKDTAEIFRETLEGITTLSVSGTQIKLGTTGALTDDLADLSNRQKAAPKKARE